MISAYGVGPNEDDAKSDGKEDPAGPDVSVHAIEEVHRHDSRDGHGLQ